MNNHHLNNRPHKNRLNENANSVLIIYPHNFFVEKSGINSRYLELLNYFKDRGIDVDLLALENFQTPWDHYPEDKWGLVRNLYFFNFRKGSKWQKPNNRKKNLFALVRKRIPFLHAHRHLPNFAYPGMKAQVEDLTARHDYDFILVSYAYWADLIVSDICRQRTTILDLSDFLTLNRFDATGGDVKVGAMLEDEIRRVALFDKVMCISEDERLFFSGFTKGQEYRSENGPENGPEDGPEDGPEYYYVPFFMKKPDGGMSNETPPVAAGTGEGKEQMEKREYDVLFVGSDNPHNRSGMEWFFEKVHPLLDKEIRILIIGSISKHVPDRKNVTCIPYVEDLSSIYTSSKIAVCPLKGGTGMKIKTVEALSHGLPVVTTSKGISGFPAKVDNGCIEVNDPVRFAGAVKSLLDDHELYQKYSNQASAFFLKHFEESQVYQVLDEIFLTGTGKK